MTVRRPVYRDREPQGGDDAIRARRLLASAPYPPNLRDDQLQWIMEKPHGVVYLDDAAICYMRVDEAAQEVQVVWWLPRADWETDNFLTILPVFSACCQEVLRRWPRSATWRLWGELQGEGETPEAMARASRQIVEYMRDRAFPLLNLTKSDSSNFWFGWQTVAYLGTQSAARVKAGRLL